MLTKSPLDSILERPGFKPFSGKRAFKILELTKNNLKITSYNLEDVLKAISSISMISDKEISLLVTLQAQICTGCGNCCLYRGSIDINKNELLKIASFRNKSYKKMKQEVKAIPIGNGKFRIQQPCKFFSGKNCEIFEVKPFTCLTYPTNEILKNLSTGIEDDFCPIINDMLSELVIKRVIEERLYKENPESFNEITEKWKKELLSLSQLSQKERLKNMILKYNKEETNS